MLMHPLAALLLLTASAAGHASNCDAIRAQVEAKVRASGVTAFSLSIVDSNASVAGKVVGGCDLGTKKIVYLPAAPILTECKDGSVSRSGDCKK